jgi:hypothetical protein
MRNTSSAPKVCLLHGSEPAHCGCPASISQANTFKQERLVDDLPWPHRTRVGSKLKGPVVVVEYFTRHPRGITVECLEARSLDHAVVIDLVE